MHTRPGGARMRTFEPESSLRVFVRYVSIPIAAGHAGRVVLRRLRPVRRELLTHAHTPADGVHPRPDGVLLGGARRIVRKDVPVAARQRVVVALREPVVLSDRVEILVAVDLRRIVDQPLRQRRAGEPLLHVDRDERLRYSVLRLSEPVLDDQEVTVLLEHVTNLFVVERYEFIAAHLPLRFWCVQLGYPGTRRNMQSRRRVETLVGWPADERADFRRHQTPRTGGSGPCAFRRGGARVVRSGLSRRAASGRIARGRGGADAGDVSTRVSKLAIVHGRDEP